MTTQSLTLTVKSSKRLPVTCLVHVKRRKVESFEIIAIGSRPMRTHESAGWLLRREYAALAAAIAEALPAALPPRKVSRVKRFLKIA